jgi:hypothetical protein
MSKGLGFLQSNIQDMLQDGDTLTVADVMEVAGPDYDPRHIRRAFKSLHRRGKVCLTVKAVLGGEGEERATFPGARTRGRCS